MRQWHPVSKTVVVVGVLALGLVALDSEQQPSQVAIAASPSRELPAVPARLLDIPDLPSIKDNKHALPPATSFSAMVQRPLFSPLRKPSEPVIVAVEYIPEEDIEPAAGSEIPEEPTEPAISLVGSLRRHGETLALIMRDDGEFVEAIRSGDEINGWRVVGISDTSLDLEAGGEHRRLEIFN